MYETYKIETLNDFLKVPANRLDACFKDFKYALATHQVVLGSAFIFPGFVWTDDGNHSVSINDQDGDLVVKLEVQ